MGGLYKGASFSDFNSIPHLWSRTEPSFALLLLQPLSPLSHTPHVGVVRGSYGAEGEMHHVDSFISLL